MPPPGGPPEAKPSVFGLPPVPFRKLYHFASPFDLALTITGCAAGFVAGAVAPLSAIVFGGGLDTFNSPVSTMDEISDQISNFAVLFFYIAAAAGGCTFLQVGLTNLSTANQLTRMRTAYVASLLRLDFAWYDTHRTSEAVARLAESTISISSGLNKVATCLNCVHAGIEPIARPCSRRCSRRRAHGTTHLLSLLTRWLPPHASAPSSRQTPRR